MTVTGRSFTSLLRIGLVLMCYCSPASAQSSQFDVASVKRNTSGDLDVMQWTFANGRFTAINVTLQMLLITAYGQSQPLPEYLIEGGPAWIGSARFDVLGTTATGAALPPLLRQLVEDRFRVRARFQQREMPMYALVLSRTDGRLGTRIRVHDSDCGTTPVTRGSEPPCGGEIRPGLITGRGLTMERIASMLARVVSSVGRPVVDNTGLAGMFDFGLSFTPSEPAVDALAGVPTLPIDPDGPSIFAALQEQLGLKLEARRGAVDVLMIDSAEMPTED